LVVGGLLFGAVLFIAVFADVLTPYGYATMLPGSQLQPPSAQHLFGTDEFDRDVFSRVIVGSRIALAYGLGSTVISIVLGVPPGLYAGFIGGRVEELIMRLMDFVLSIPPFMLALLMLSVVTPNASLAILAIGIISAPSLVRIARSVALGLREEEFVEAAIASGESSWSVIGRELLPNFWPILLVEASLRITFGILLGASLSFLGFGAQPPASDWGLLLSEARPFLTTAPWMAIYPGLAMVITVIGVNLLSSGLRDILDPRLRR
jgi:peptide/nickel transport system permease protein